MDGWMEIVDEEVPLHSDEARSVSTFLFRFIIAEEQTDALIFQNCVVTTSVSVITFSSCHGYCFPLCFVSGSCLQAGLFYIGWDAHKVCHSLNCSMEQARFSWFFY